jgi:hypothetical protein
MAQAVSRRPLTAEAQDCTGVNPCGICTGQNVIEAGYSTSSWVFSCQYHSTVTLHTHMTPRDEQQARWWPQFRDIVSPHRHE